jgi:hypothetical protein
MVRPELAVVVDPADPVAATALELLVVPVVPVVPVLPVLLPLPELLHAVSIAADASIAANPVIVSDLLR